MSIHGQCQHTPKKCKGCAYRTEAYKLSMCEFSIVTGKIRGCPPEECTHYTKEKEKKEDFEE